MESFTQHHRLHSPTLSNFVRHRGPTLYPKHSKTRHLRHSSFGHPAPQYPVPDSNAGVNAPTPLIHSHHVQALPFLWLSIKEPSPSLPHNPSTSVPTCFRFSIILAVTPCVTHNASSVFDDLSLPSPSPFSPPPFFLCLQTPTSVASSLSGFWVVHVPIPPIILTNSVSSSCSSSDTSKSLFHALPISPTILRITVQECYCTTVFVQLALSPFHHQYPTSPTIFTQNCSTRPHLTQRLQKDASRHTQPARPGLTHTRHVCHLYGIDTYTTLGYSGLAKKYHSLVKQSPPRARA